MRVTKEIFSKYINATCGNKSYLIEDRNKSGIDIETFIFIADNFESLKIEFGGKNNANKQFVR